MLNHKIVEEDIEEIVNWFFDKINIPLIQNIYISDLQNWDALCASLTIIKDLQRAKKEFYALQAINHLTAIGIMQTIYIEQDCVLTLKNAILNTSEKILINYHYIRSLRNEAFGHPSKKQKGKVFSRHFFDIIDIEKQTLKIINWEGTGEVNSSSFNLPEMVLTNSGETQKYLLDIQRDFISKINFTMEKYTINTSKLFNGANYIFEKLLTKMHDRIALDTFCSMKRDISQAKDALIERNLFDEYKREIELISFFYNKIEPLLDKQTYQDIEFYAYVISLRREIDSIKRSFTEIEKIFN